jgi:hypothetical protein
MTHAGIIHIYTLTEIFNKTANSSVYITEHVITLRAEEPRSFDKFGAVAESDGQDTLWISSGWANEEDGAVWSYNVAHGLSKFRKSELVIEDEEHNRLQFSFERPREHYEVAKVFAHGSEPKVILFLRKL